MQITGITKRQLEDLLAQPEYKAFKRVNYATLTDELREGVLKAEAVTSFGTEVINQFDEFLLQQGRLPTQKEYVEQGLALYQKFWEDNKDTHRVINGYSFTKGVKLGCMNRLARTYNSKLVEIHLELMLSEMGFAVKSHPLLDAVMGVDMVIQDDLKRYYIHVTSSSKGKSFAEKSVKKKESRGKFLHRGKWVSYGRDFKRDTILCYSSFPIKGDNSTKWINNLPLFKEEYIREQLLCMELSVNQGERLEEGYSKLAYFKAWAENTLGEKLSI